MPFEKGNQLGKLGGRKKAQHTLDAEKARAYITERVTKELAPIMDKAIAQAKAGDQTTRRDLMDRAYGRPKETVEYQGDISLKIDL